MIKKFIVVIATILLLLPVNVQAVDQVTRSSTLVVAASDSTALCKSQADYVCDGTADDVEIQDALDSGKSVLCLRGSYYTSSPIQLIGNCLSLTFEPGGVIWYSGTDSAFKLKGGWHTLIFDQIMATGSAIGVATAIKDLGCAESVVRGKRIGYYSPAYYFANGIWFDNANATAHSISTIWEVNVVDGGSYGLRLDSGTYHLEGSQYNIPNIRNNSTLSARIGTSTSDVVAHNTFILGLDGAGTSTKALEIWNSDNTITLNACLGYSASPPITFNGQYAFQNILIFGGATIPIDDLGVNTVITGTQKQVTSKVIYTTRDMTAASGDVAYTGVGFKPSVIICFADVFNTSYASWGVSDSAKNSALIEEYTHGNRTSASWLIYLSENASASDRQTAIVKSYDTDGFTLTWTKTGNPAPATAYLVFLCLR